MPKFRNPAEVYDEARFLSGESDPFNPKQPKKKQKKTKKKTKSSCGTCSLTGSTYKG